MTYNRPERVGEEIRKEIAVMLFEEIHDPRIGFVTITKVAVSKDLRQAKVYFSIMGSNEEKKKTTEGLQSASGYLKREIGKRLKLRYFPDIVFKFDDSLEYASRIEEIIKEIKGGTEI
ncbi:MAG: 30S ribosome-binding factor RbfA [Deltaproteobacteria bacterium]|nr:30S ribosome-binding factor RbfA [Deltaproteobacteria bacterium]